MHFLLVTQYFHPEVGATQTRMREFAKALVRRGHQVTVLTEFPNHPTGRIPPEYRGRWFTREAMEGYSVLRVWVWASPAKTFWNRLAFYISFLLMAVARGLFYRERISAVVATSPPLSVGLAGYILSLLRRTKFVLDIRDLWPAAAQALDELRNPFFLHLAERVERHLYRHADRITAVTQGFCRHIRAFVRNPSGVEWLPNGTVSGLFSPDLTDPSLRERLGLQGKFVVCFAGLHGIAQGLPSILNAASLLRQASDVRFLFVGDGPVKGSLIQKAREMELNNVLFHPQVPIEKITSYLTMSDLLLVPLRRDPLFDIFVPSKLFDFMACARPVLLTVGGEAQAILEEAGGGKWVEPENPAAMAEAILAFRDNPGKREEMGRRGRDYVLRGFTREAQGDRLATILEELSSQRARAQA